MSEKPDQFDLAQTSPEQSSQPSARFLPRRTLDRLAWALLALALGWIAQALFSSQGLWPGLLLYVIAIPLFAFQLSRRTRCPPSEPQDVSIVRQLQANFGLAPGVRGGLGLGVAAAAVILSFVSLPLFILETRNALALTLHAISLFLFVGGVWLLEPGVREGKTPVRSGQQPEAVAQVELEKQAKSPDVLLVAILLLAMFFRLFHFFSVPFGTWYDEAELGILARRVLQDPTFRPTTWGALTEVPYLLYLFVFSCLLFGVNTPALRVVPVLFGVGCVLFAYLFGKEWKGRRWGLLLAFLVATMRWHVSFSRIAMTGVDAPFFEFATLYFATRAWRTGRLRPLVGTGLSLGLGLCFYEAFRLFVAALILLVAGWLALGGWRKFSNPQPSSFKFLLVRLGLVLLAVWFAVMPVAQFALRHSDEFLARSRTISIFVNRDEPNLGRALLESAKKHLLMFNYQGDRNGRHNLPGAPTLDRLSAVLFAVGLGLASLQRDRGSVFFLLLLTLGLGGGILTVDFEAPQSLRSIAALPAVVYFIALSLDALWLELRRSARITQPRYSLALVFAGLGAIAVGNGYTYFGPQAHDKTVWSEFSTAETLVGKKMAELGPEPLYFASPFFYDHVVIRFHAPVEASPTSHKVMPLPDPLPAREPADRPVVYFIHPDEEWVFSLAHEIYPTAHFETLPADPDYAPAVFVVYLEPEDIASVQGLEVRYWPGEAWDGLPQAGTRSPVIDTSWPAAAPLPLPFAAEWDGVLYAPWYGQYVLGLEAPARAEMTLDGKTVEGSGELTLAQQLARGNHTLRLRVIGGSGQVRLWWQPPQAEKATVPSWVLYSPPVSSSGLLGKYYASPNWQGAPALERIDPTLNLYFHLTPLPRPYSVEWTGTLNVPQSGIYELGLRAVDQARLYLDGQLAVDASAPDELTLALLELAAGPHDLRITYQDLTGRSRIHLYWTRPGGEREIIPSSYLWPGQAGSQPVQPPPSLLPAQNLPPMELTWVDTWGSPGDEPGQLLEPRDVAVIGDSVFIADTGNRRVQVWGMDGTFRQGWTGGAEPFQEPLALGIDSQNRLLVLDSVSGWIYRFDASGRSLDRIGGPALQLYHPRGMTALKDDTLAVPDTGGGRLLFLDPVGNIRWQVGGYGPGLAQFGEPTDVIMDTSGTFYVAEAFNQRLQRINDAGTSLGGWPIPPSVAHDGPHMAWAPDGSLLMSAPEQGAILRFAPDGQLLNQWTQAGVSPLCRPVGIYVDEANRILYVTDTTCHHVYIFEID
jgi:4-amino-4-deoxy-L-arabinose transferase-like glycosyltransferase